MRPNQIVLLFVLPRLPYSRVGKEGIRSGNLRILSSMQTALAHNVFKLGSQDAGQRHPGSQDAGQRQASGSAHLYHKF